MSKYREILKRYWTHTAFRPLQEEIIESVGRGRDTLALMPTGGGKSLTFQVPAMAKEGICLVITPLIALMKDQVEHLNKLKIKALAVHSGLSREEIDHALDNCIFGDVKFLYLSPERLATEIFRVRLREMNVNLIAVDEAHCISQWGYDFRPSYLRIPELRELLPGVPVLALTATATPVVARDIMEKLDFKENHLLKKSFDRSNLAYVVRHCEDKERELTGIAEKVDGSAIVYVRNRKKTREIAKVLKSAGISAEHYHAGLSYEERSRKQEEWQNGQVRIMVATNAFGMGIDKADVRFVLHMDLPDSPEAYFQEAGRAGRDEKKSWAILLYSPADEKKLQQRIAVNFPGLDKVREVYKALNNFLQVPLGSGKGQSYDFIMGEFLSRYRFNALIATNALTTLSREGYFEISDAIHNPSRIMFIIGRDDLYRFQVKNQELDGFIKLLLRSYTGFFSQYVAIDENLLARRAGISYEQVYKYLLSLSRSQVIRYIPRKKDPVITFLEERLEDKNLYLSSKLYRFRKDQYLLRIKEMLAYVKSETRCRNQFLLSYFGEKKTERCGRCDVCLNKERHSVSSKKAAVIREKIRELLSEKAYELADLVSALEASEKDCIVVIEAMLNEGEIRRNDDLMLVMD